MSRPISSPRFPGASRLGVIAVLTAALAGASFAQQPGAAPGATVTNAEITAQIADATKALDRASAELAGLRDAKRDIDESLQRIESRAAVYAAGREFARTLIDQRARLPQAEHLSAVRQERARLLTATSDAHIRVERMLGKLAGPDAAADPALAKQRDLLAQLADLQYRLLQALKESDEATRDLERTTRAAREKLTQLLFWVPAPPKLRTLDSLGPSLAWTFSPANWRGAVAVVGDALARRPFWPAIALLAAAGLVALRRRLQGALVSLAPAAVGYADYRMRHALAALAITFALALPGPILLWTAASLLGTAPESQPFTLALGDSLGRIARLVLALSAFAWLLDRRAMAVGHFGWNEEAADFVARALRRFAMLFVPLLLLATLNGLDHAPPPNRDSLGRFAFNFAMIALAAFLAHLLRRRNPLVRNLVTRAPRTLAVRLHGFWWSALVALPLALVALAMAGYLTAAGYFFGRGVESLFLVLGAVLLYGLIALWVRVQRDHLRRRRDEAARPADAGAGEEAGSEIAELRPPDLSVAALGEQTRSLLDLLITLLLLGGLWGIWRDALPVLSVISDYALWTYASEGGAKNSVTVGGLTLAILVGVVTTVAVRNVGALLDIVLLQRLEMQADATYAIKVLARYLIAGGGIVLASQMLGIAWGDVHWLIAAMGVGLGFGLQEIVANFVSGLILLAERPIRIGDQITVGDVTGTVARIRARATAVVDGERREVIIPNKAFITERVINWTLTDQITRLLLTVGVAYGSDIELVQRVVLDAVRANPDVLQEPAPSVFFTNFGDSTLDFEIRAFVDSLDKRLRVRHEINVAVARVLGEHGIEISFPQRDVHIRSAPGLPGAPGFKQGG